MTGSPEEMPAAPPQPNATEFCAQCGTPFKEGALFCEMCGAVRPSLRTAPPMNHMDWRTWAIRQREQQPTYKHTPWRSMMKALMAICLLSVIFSLIMGLIALVYGVGLVTPYILNTDYSFPLFVVLPVFVTLLSISGYPLLAYYYVLVAVIVASCAWVLLTSYRGFTKELTMKAKSREHSPIFDIAGLVSVNAFLTFAIVIIAILFGATDTSGPSTGDLEGMLFELANASVWEEVIVRILLIGIPLLVIDLIRKSMIRGKQMRNIPVKALQERPLHRYILGGKFEIGIPEVALVMISAIIFGYAHFLGGWGFWKVPAAAIGGIAFGYLFLRYGLAAGIVMHFTVDYSSMPSEVFGYSNTIEVVLILFWLAVGFVFTVYYLTRIGEFLSGQKFLEERPQPTLVPWPQPVGYQPMGPPRQSYASSQYPPPQPGEQDLPAVVPGQAAYGGYVCPVCGNTEARWINGRFQCLRCGNLT